MSEFMRVHKRASIAAALGCVLLVVLGATWAVVRLSVSSRPRPAPGPPVDVPSFDPSILNQDIDPETWWSTHPYNPDSLGYIPVGGLAPRDPIVDVRTQFNWNLQAAIDALPASGGTLYLPAGLYATNAYNEIRGRGNIQLVGDPNGGTMIRQRLDIMGCQASENCDYGQFNQCVYQAAISHDTSTACWQIFTNTPARNIYIKNVTFDGGYEQRGANGQCAGDWSDSIAVGLIATKDILFDNVTFQNYCDPILSNPDRDSTTGLGQCIGACHPGLVNFSGGNDNVWCRRCRFLGPGRYPWYSDGTRGSGLIGSYVLFKGTLEANSRFVGGPIFLNNDDFTMDENFDGTFEKSELRFPQLAVIADNTFTGYTSTHVIDYAGATALIMNNTVDDPEGRVIPYFVTIDAECSYLWSANYGLSYQGYGNELIGNHIDTGVNTFVQLNGARGSAPQAGIECHTPSVLGHYTVRGNRLAGGAELNGEPFSFIQEIPPVDGPNVVDDNCVAGQEYGTGLSCPEQSPTPVIGRQLTALVGAWLHPSSP
jgi:hypothetical protein